MGPEGLCSFIELDMDDVLGFHAEIAEIKKKIEEGKLEKLDN